MGIYCKPQSYSKLFVILILMIFHVPSLLAFEKAKLKLAGQTLKIEIANTDSEHAQGLMHRKKLENDQGMLFVFKDERARSFWMKNTFIDLDILFFDQKQLLVEQVTLLGVKSEMQLQIPQYTSQKPAQYVLEVPAGWSLKHKLKMGSKFILDK